MKKKDKYMAFSSDTFDIIMFAIDEAIGYGFENYESIKVYEELTNYILENSLFVPEKRLVYIPLSENHLKMIIAVLFYLIEPYGEPELTYDNILKRDTTKIFRIIK